MVNTWRLDPARVNDRSSGENGALELLRSELELHWSFLGLVAEFSTLFAQQPVKNDFHELLDILEKGLRPSLRRKRKVV